MFLVRVTKLSVGANVRIESAPGEGAAVVITLGTSPRPAPGLARLAIRIPLYENLDLLLVDDEEVGRQPR